MAEGEANDARESTIGLIEFTLFLFTTVIFCRWIVRANKNIRALGAIDLRFTPGWAAGFFFIPIVCLWKPCHAMKDLWQASNNPTDWSGTNKDVGLITIWWTLWIGSNFLAQISFRVMMDAQEIEGLLVGTYFQIASLAVGIPLSLVAMSLVSQIAIAQTSYEEMEEVIEEEMEEKMEYEDEDDI